MGRKIVATLLILMSLGLALYMLIILPNIEGLHRNSAGIGYIGRVSLLQCIVSVVSALLVFKTPK